MSSVSSPHPQTGAKAREPSIALPAVGGWGEEMGSISSCGDFKGLTRLASFPRPRPRTSQMEALLAGSFDVIKLYYCWRNEDSAVYYCCFVITGRGPREWKALFFFSGGLKGYGLEVMVEVFCGILSDAALGPNIRRWSGDKRAANLACAFINEMIRFPCFFVRVLTMVCSVYSGTMLCCFKPQHFCRWIRRPNAISHESF